MVFLYARWSKTRMANVVRDPRQHPDAFIPDFSVPDPLLTFKKEDVAFSSACVACHMPAIEQTIADVNVRSHTFRFITPSTTDRLKVPNPCTGCHTDNTTAWATAALKSWPEFSPWRVGR